MPTDMQSGGLKLVVTQKGDKKAGLNEKNKLLKINGLA